MAVSNRLDEESASGGLESWSQTLDFQALADTYGTPTYILNAPQLRHNLRKYLKIVERPCQILYPVKANPAFAVLRRLADLGCGMDCASRDEVDLALIAGIPIEHISYNTPAPEFGLIRNLLRAGATVVVDSEELLRRINARVPESHARGPLVVRLNIQVGSEYLQHFEWEDMVHHGSGTSKFGIPAERIIGLFQQLSLPVSGLHVHVGTMMDNLAAFENLLSFLHQLVDEIHVQTRHRISMLNLGGGLGINFVPGQTFPTIDALAQRLLPMKRSGISYYLEPGQSLVGDTMGLLTRVLTLKQMRDKRWAIIDVGSDQLMKITTVSWYHQILDQRHQPLSFEGPDSIGGPLCFAGDTILPTTLLRDVREGEVLFLQHAGAYLEAIANRFNGRRSTGLIVIDDGTIHRATHPEDPYFSPPIQTYDWQEGMAKQNSVTELSQNQIDALRSDYFSQHGQSDRYSIVKFSQTSLASYSFEVETQASVDFISVPFAMRIVADAVIVAVLMTMGKTVKDVSLWGSKGTFNYKEPIQPGQTLTGTVTLSPLATGIAGQQRVLSVATLDGGRFSMTSEVVV